MRSVPEESGRKELQRQQAPWPESKGDITGCVLRSVDIWAQLQGGQAPRDGLEKRACWRACRLLVASTMRTMDFISYSERWRNVTEYLLKVDFFSKDAKFRRMDQAEFFSQVNRNLNLAFLRNLKIQDFICQENHCLPSHPPGSTTLRKLHLVPD